MHHLSLCSRRRSPISRVVRGCQDLVRFFALFRIKPHAPPLVYSSIPLSFSLGTVLPGGVLNALTSALKGGNPLTLSTHRLRRGLPGYLILFAPHAFAPVSVTDQKVAFATGVPPYLYAFHRYTWNSTFLFCTQVSQFPMTSTVEPWAFTSDLRNHLRAPLRPIIPDNACHLRITALLARS